MVALWPLLWLFLELCALCGGVAAVYKGWPISTTPYSNTLDIPLSVERNGCTCVGGSESSTVCQGVRSCKRFPGDNVFTPQLRVMTTAITTIYIGDLSNLGHLKSLTIDDNYKLSTIEPGVFNGMDALEFLSISQNSHLTHLAKGTFKGLYNLTELLLTHNGFLKIPDIAHALLPKFLPRLLNLSLNQNSLHRINAYDLLPLNGTRLIELKLRLCQLDFIHPEAMKPLRYLRNLQLGQNSLNATTLTNLIRQMTRDNITLQSIDLCLMGFQKQPPRDLLTAIGEAGIESLDLEQNQFQSLKKGSFPSMPRLQYLNLKKCYIVSVEPGTFDASLLPELRTLGLSSNQLTGVSPGVLPQQVTDLDFSWNSYDRLQQPVNFNLGEGNFLNMTNLINLNISFVTVDTITSKTFSGLRNLKSHLGLMNASVNYIDPGSFRELTNLTFLSLEHNSFPSKTGLTVDTFQGLESLEVLILTGCGISSITDVNVFSPLTLLNYLMLEDNEIVTLSPKIFAPLVNLIGLSLKKNMIEPWVDEPLFGNNSNISKVLLSDNRLTYLSPVMLQDFSKLDHLALDNNLFICDCHALYQAKRWLNVNNFSLEMIISPGSVPYCYSPDIWRNRYITDFIALSEYEDDCPLSNGGSDVFYIWVGVILGILVLLGAVCGILGYKYRSYIRYWAFLARMDMRRRGMSRYMGRRKVTLKGYTNYQYDAFVSYSSEDRNFVVRLVAMLENYEPFLKLCVYERDFEIGTVISESVLESVATSRRTLLIISDAFAKSQWCMWELRLAEHHRLFFEDDDNMCGRRDDPLVMVKLGDVRASNMTPTLKYLLKTRIYLEWDHEPRKQRLFWQKLRATLAPPNIAIKTTTQ